MIVTDEDPRLEDPRAINEQIADGARAAGARDGEDLFVIDDRTAAIAHAVWLARPGDVILLAGKGHEGSIIYGTRAAGGTRRRSRARALRAAGHARTRRDPMPELRAWRVTDPAAWNAFVERAPRTGRSPQLWEWGELRRARSAGSRCASRWGRTARCPPLAAAQVLLRRVPGVGWRLGYVPRGPVGELDERDVREAMFAALRSLGRGEARGHGQGRSRGAGGVRLSAPRCWRPPWRPAAKVQPPRTRLIDLAPSKDELRSALKRKHRQYVNKAERAGIAVERIDGSADEATRARGARRLLPHLRPHRGARRVRGAGPPLLRPRLGAVRAERPRPAGLRPRDGERLATLFHFTCGDRAAEAFGGMTDAGADERANYLLKWASIIGFKEEGFAAYDLWGLATGGIAQFKEGFGGRQVDYVGARDLPLRRAEDAALRLLLPAYGIAQRTRLRLMGRHLAGSED